MAFNYRLQYREARSPNNCIPASIDISTAISTDSIRLCFYVCPLHSSNFVIISSSTLETIETPRNGRIVLEFFFVLSSFFLLFLRYFVDKIEFLKKIGVKWFGQIWLTCHYCLENLI